MRRKRKGYVKIHVAIDIKTKQAVSLEVTDEKTHDGETVVPLVREAQRKVKVKGALGLEMEVTTPTTTSSFWPLRVSMVGLR
jgi:hypothetical protein